MSMKTYLVVYKNQYGSLQDSDPLEGLNELKDCLSSVENSYDGYTIEAYDKDARLGQVFTTDAGEKVICIGVDS